MMVGVQLRKVNSHRSSNSVDSAQTAHPSY